LKDSTPQLPARVHQAELMREVGLKCIGLIGVARVRFASAVCRSDSLVK
jgi:hypothetical protein